MLFASLLLLPLGLGAARPTLAMGSAAPAEVEVPAVPAWARESTRELAGGGHSRKKDVATGDDIVHYELPWWHPDVQWVTDNMIASVDSHPLLDEDPKFQAFVRSNTGEVHNFLDPESWNYIREPWGMPEGHPSVEDYFLYQDVPVDDLPVQPFDHTDVDAAYTNEETLPEGHPSVHNLLDHLLPGNHPDVDDLFANHQELPEWHIELSLAVVRADAPPPEEPASADGGGNADVLDEGGYIAEWADAEPTTPADGSAATTAEDDAASEVSEPPEAKDDAKGDVGAVASGEGDEGGSAEPVSADSQAAASDDGSGDTNAIVFARGEFATGDAVTTYSLPWWHPDVHWAALNEIPGISNHPLLDDHPEFQKFIRANTGEVHNFYDPDSWDFIRNPWGLPDGHPNLQNYFVHEENPMKPVSIFSGHPNLNEELGDSIDNHPPIHHFFEAHIPESHPDIDTLMMEGFELPIWHPDVGGEMVQRRSLATSPASILAYIVLAILVVIALARSATRWKNSKQTDEMTVDEGSFDIPPPPPPLEERVWSLDSLSDSRGGDLEVTYKDHVDVDVGSHRYEERVLICREKRAGWKDVFGGRVPKTSFSRGEAALLLCYLLVNVAALLASPTYAIGVGFGSLSAGNLVFVFVTAARNGVLTWYVGASFEKILVYHRFFGRLTVLLGFIHGCFHIDYMFAKTSDPTIVTTGLVSLGFGVLILLTSLNYIRRRFFRFFFWTHYAFVGFVVALGLHAPGARPFIYASIGCYCIDKAAQMVWKLPKTSTTFDKVDERTLRVQFAKAPLSITLGMHKCGQYVFINFPSISWQEWHPFSVASGPDDPNIDIYIRA
ncbi:hypothetical protein ACHAWF_014524 [Thalassiosira exigua]